MLLKIIMLSCFAKKSSFCLKHLRGQRSARKVNLRKDNRFKKRSLESKQSHLVWLFSDQRADKRQPDRV